MPITGASRKTPGKFYDNGGMAFNVQHPDYGTGGAKGDVRQVADGAITTGTPTLTSATAAFTTADAGKVIAVAGAGAAGAVLTTTIAAYVNATTVTLAVNASTTVTGASVGFGTDDTAAITAASAAAANGPGAFVQFPPGKYLFTSRLSIPATVEWRGAGKTATQLVIGSALCGTDGGVNGVALIAVNNNCTVRRMGVRPLIHPVIKAGTTAPVLHDWVFGHKNSGNTTIEAVRFYGCWRGISGGAEPGPNSGCEVVRLRDLDGCCLKACIFLDQATDAPHIEQYHFHPNFLVYYDNDLTSYDLTTLLTYLRTNTPTVLRMRRVDWGVVSGGVAYGYYEGLVLEIGTNTAAGRADVAFSHCGWDGAQYAATISDCVSAAFDVCTFAVRRNAAETPVIGMKVTAPIDARVGLGNCQFKAEASDILLNLTGAATVQVGAGTYFNSAVKGIVASAGRLMVDDALFGFTSGTVSDIELSGSAIISGRGNKRADGTALVTVGCTGAAVDGLWENPAEIELSKKLKATAGLYTIGIGPAVLANGATTYYTALPANSTWLVWAAPDTTTSGLWRASGIVRVGSATITIDSFGASQLALVGSGLTIGVTNSTGGSINLLMGLTRLA